MYRTVSRWALTETVEVPLTTNLVHDLEAMRAAIRDDTTVVYICNPNNPTGTIVNGDQLDWFVGSVPERVLIVVDEAYHDYVTDELYRSALALAAERSNVIVLRTFSKIFGLASHRVGYAIGAPATVAELRKTQIPFSISEVAQAAATASLGDEAEHRRRVKANQAGRHHLMGVIEERALPLSDSLANCGICKAVQPPQVVQQLRKGYLLRERLIRPATVVIAKKPSA
jgi:histidinol-phosphate aminotransferase